MTATDYISSVLIIDDLHDEVIGLETALDSNDILHTYCNPDDLPKLPYKNRQLIFCDLFMGPPSAEVKGHVAILRRILEKVVGINFGSYGLVLWTKHIDDITLVKEAISQDHDKYRAPLFIVGLDKTEYIAKDSYESILNDLNDRLIKDKAAYFFLNWMNSVSVGADRAVSEIYELAPEYSKQSIELSYILYILACNYSGVAVKNGGKYEGMYQDAYKAFDELLFTSLVSQQMNLDFDIFGDDIQNPWGDSFEKLLEKMSLLNASILIEREGLHQNLVLPGSVYWVKTDNHLLVGKDNPKKSKPIAIELTPPCDNAHKKVQSRLIGGFMLPCPKTKEKLKEYVDKNFKAENKYLIWPIHLDGEDKFLCFDFRKLCSVDDSELMDGTKYELAFFAKHKLFSDILQKFSSHAARLGVALIKPDID